MPRLPADKDHVTQSSVGQLCDGNVCSICNTCDQCGRVLNVTPHIEVCACPEGQSHYVCDEPECQAVLALIDDRAAARVG